MVERAASNFRVLLENVGANCWGRKRHGGGDSFAQRLANAKRTDMQIVQSAEAKLSAEVNEARTSLQERQ